MGCRELSSYSNGGEISSIELHLCTAVCASHAMSQRSGDNVRVSCRMAVMPLPFRDPLAVLLPQLGALWGQAGGIW